MWAADKIWVFNGNYVPTENVTRRIKDESSYLRRNWLVRAPNYISRPFVSYEAAWNYVDYLLREKGK